MIMLYLNLFYSAVCYIPSSVAIIMPIVQRVAFPMKHGEIFHISMKPIPLNLCTCGNKIGNAIPNSTHAFKYAFR